MRLDKVFNELSILDSLRTNNRLSIPDIASMNKLSRPTVDSAIKQMEMKGIVVKDGYAKSETGRKPVLWKLNGNSGIFLGVDFEPPVIRLLALNMCREVVYSDNLIFPECDDVYEVLDCLTQAIHDCITQKLSLPIESLKAISIGNPGEIDNKTGVSLTMHNWPTWQNVPIVSYVNKSFKCPIYLENVILLMANAERERLTKEGIRDFIYISLRAGVGASLCINGEFFNGTTGNAGHFGRIPISNPLFDDKRCIEECSDGYMILNRMIEHGIILESMDVVFPISTEYLDLLVDEAETNNIKALNILEEVADYWAYGIASSICLLDIPVIVLGGMFSYVNTRSSLVGDFFLKSISKKYIEKYQAAKPSKFRLRFANYYDNAAALGGAILGYEKFFHNGSLPSRGLTHTSV